MAGTDGSETKLTALREQGTLYARATTVSDELFRTNTWFDPHDLVQVKYEMLRRVRLDNQSVTRAAAAFGFSRLSFYQTRAAFEQRGLSGLVPRKRGPQGPHKLTAKVLIFLREMRAEDASLRASDMARRVTERFGIQVHPRTIERTLARREKKRIRSRRAGTIRGGHSIGRAGRKVRGTAARRHGRRRKK